MILYHMDLHLSPTPTLPHSYPYIALTLPCSTPTPTLPHSYLAPLLPFTQNKSDTRSVQLEENSEYVNINLSSSVYTDISLTESNTRNLNESRHTWRATDFDELIEVNEKENDKIKLAILRVLLCSLYISDNLCRYI